MARNPHLAGRISRVEPASSHGVTVELDLRLEARAGQFVMVWLPRVDEKPFSLVDDDPVTLTIVQVGPFTERMQRVRPGETLYLRGPFGNGFSLDAQRPLLIAGGCGAAPLALLAKRLAALGRQVTVALGARTAADLLLAERFQGLGARLLPSTEDGTAGQLGLVTELVAAELARGEHDHVYACGPGAMLDRVAELCRTCGVPGELSREAYMRCGIGICGSCDCGNGLLVCRDGPVFRVATGKESFDTSP